MSNGSRHAAYLLPETVYGTTPVTGTFAAIRHTGFSIGTSTKTLQSAEIRSDRQIADYRLGSNHLAGAIDVEPAFDATFDSMLEATLCGTWASGVLKAGTTRRSFSILRNFSDLASGNPFHLLSGVEFGGLKLTCGADAMVQASFDCVGQALTLAATAPAGPTLGTPSTTSPMDAFSGTLTEGGSTVNIVTGVDLTLHNGIAPRFIMGSKNTIRPAIGRSNLSGKITVYFEDTTLLAKFLGETSSTLDFFIQAGTHSYEFKLPNIKYTGGQPDVKGEGPITLTMPFQAVYGTSDASQIVITKV